MEFYEKTGKIWRVFGSVIFVAVFLFVVNELFLGFGFGNDDEVKTPEVSDVLRVVYPDEPSSLEPTLIDSITRQRLVNVYEPLVKFDRDLKIKPDLAVSYGLIEPTVWEFSLKDGVKFHDGSAFDSEDVIASVKRAKSNKNSDLVGMLSTIGSVEKIDDLTLRMKTLKPDPLLLQKLALLMIVPSEAGQELASASVGTGPYKFAFWDKSGEPHKIILEAFDKRAKFKKVEMISQPDKFIRTKMLIDGETDLLTFVPFDAVDILKEKGFEMSAFPSLEVQFLVFNFKSKYFSNLENRKLVSLVVDQDYLVEAVGGFARRVSQFVSNGNFGFAPKISEHEYDLEKAKTLDAGIKGQTISIHLSVGLDLLGEHLRKQLKEVGVSAVVSYMDGEKLLQSMQNGDADLYFLALKSDLGDSASFFEDVALTSGKFNIARYSNPALDELVGKSSVEMDPELRLKNLQEAMEIVVAKDYFGVPLFEYETVYGFDSKFDFEPRIDGMIYFEDVTKKS